MTQRYTQKEKFDARKLATKTIAPLQIWSCGWHRMA